MQDGLWLAVDRFRLNFRDLLANSPILVNKPLLTALSVGERSGLDPSVTELLSDSGLSRLVAISGLHIELAAGVMMALAYSLVAGLPISIVRALAMAVIGAALLLTCIHSSANLLLATIMFVVVMFSPERWLLQDSGFHSARSGSSAGLLTCKTWIGINLRMVGLPVLLLSKGT